MKRNVWKALLATSLLAASVAALAEPTCTEAPRSEWMSEAEMKQRIADMGYTIKEFKVTDGHCYELYGWNDQKQRVEIYFDPVNGEVVKQDVD